MELVLNVGWLLLLMVSIGNCLYVSRSLGDSKRPHRFRSVLLVVCLLAVLFPVVSVSDDLCALRMESEDGSASQGNGKSHKGHSTPDFGKTIPLFSDSLVPSLIAPKRDPRFQVWNLEFVPIELLLTPERPSRAPPHGKSLVMVASLKAQPVDLDLFPQRPSPIHWSIGSRVDFLPASMAGANNRSSEWEKLLVKTTEDPQGSVWKKIDPFQRSVSG